MSWLHRLSPWSHPRTVATPGTSAPSSMDNHSEDQRLREQVLAVHGDIVDQVVQLAAGDELGMADGFELRFDLLVLFVSALLHRLHDRVAQASLSQMLWDVTFESLEESLRERGVTDLRLASRMRTLLQSATGRRNAYLAAWDRPGDPDAIRAVIARNVLNGAAISDSRIDILLACLPGSAEHLPGIARPGCGE
ncbi:MAG: ubiquinol-cytochrome C chaperone family protein [Magnetococcus sp. DMHC-8]